MELSEVYTKFGVAHGGNCTLTHHGSNSLLKHRSSFGLLSLLILLGLLLSAIPSQGTDEDQGFLPPNSKDKSLAVAGIRSLLDAADLAGAQRASELLIAAEPHNFEGHFWRGITQLRRLEGYEAVRSLRRAEALDANPYVVKALGVAYYTIRQFRLFLLKMNEAIAKQPKGFSAYYYLGRYYADEINDFGKAAQYFEDAITRNSRHYQSIYYLGYCAEIQRTPAEAAQKYEMSIEIAEAAHARYASPYQGMARLSLAKHDLEAALRFALRATEISPGDPASHQVLAKSYAALGRRPEEVREWEQAAQLDPSDASVFYHLFRLYRSMGDEQKAAAAQARFDKLNAMY